MKKRILVVDDQEETVALLRRGLQEKGYEVFTARSRREARKAFDTHRLDLVLLDLGLPDGEGLVLCEEFQARNPDLPIIVVSAREDERIRVQAFKHGATDYVVKRFLSVPEILERVRVQLEHVQRIYMGKEEGSFEAGPLKIDFERRSVMIHEHEIYLTQIEYDLLHFLVKNNGKTMMYDQIIRAVWGNDNTFDHRNIHVFINHLRRKIEDTTEHHFIQNIPKVGYRFQADYFRSVAIKRHNQ